MASGRVRGLEGSWDLSRESLYRLSRTWHWMPLFTVTRWVKMLKCGWGRD